MMPVGPNVAQTDEEIEALGRKVREHNAANPPDSPQALLGYCSALQGRYSDLFNRVTMLSDRLHRIESRRPWWKFWG